MMPHYGVLLGVGKGLKGVNNAHIMVLLAAYCHNVHLCALIAPPKVTYCGSLLGWACGTVMGQYTYPITYLSSTCSTHTTLQQYIPRDVPCIPMPYI